MLQIHLKSNGMPYTLKNTMKPNFRSAEWQHLTTKALGFTRSVVDVACFENTWFFYGFYGFDGIRSTQPTKTKCITFSITPQPNLRDVYLLGFARSVVDVACFENTWFFYGFYGFDGIRSCLLYTSPSPRDRQKSRMPSSA